MNYLKEIQILKTELAPQQAAQQFAAGPYPHPAGVGAADATVG